MQPLGLKLIKEPLGESPLVAAALLMAPFAARPGLPPALALVGLASVFGLSAYTIHIDKHYGPSTFTAWGIVYLTVFAKPAVVSRAFVPIAYTACVLAATATYGWETLQSF